jgi:hypothetical protein
MSQAEVMGLQMPEELETIPAEKEAEDLIA